MKPQHRYTVGEQPCQNLLRGDADIAALGIGNRRNVEAHTAAVLLARSIGRDVGVCRQQEFGKDGFNVRSLPRAENRYGHEMFCEVVTPGDPL